MPDDDHVPPLKVMRKRLNGVYRADSGFSGPTRRYVLIVAMLVGLASVPTLAAITAGRNELADGGGGADTMDIPFLPPASPGPVQGGLGASPPAKSPSLPPGIAGSALRAGRLAGEAGRRRSRSRSAAPAAPAHSGRKSGSDKSAAPARSTAPQHLPAMAAFPALPGMPALAHLPRVGNRPSRPSSGGSSKPPRAADSFDPLDFANGHDAIDLPAVPGSDFSHLPDLSRSARQGHHQCARSTDKDRSPDRSEHSRRSPVAERPQNIRASRILERSYSPGTLNARRLIPEARTEENQIDRPYRGSHRAGSLHHAEDTAAQQRSSRVGRHHAEPTEDITGRW